MSQAASQNLPRIEGGSALRRRTGCNSAQYGIKQPDAKTPCGEINPRFLHTVRLSDLDAAINLGSALAAWTVTRKSRGSVRGGRRSTVRTLARQLEHGRVEVRESVQFRPRCAPYLRKTRREGMKFVCGETVHFFDDDADICRCGKVGKISGQKNEKEATRQ